MERRRLPARSRLLWCGLLADLGRIHNLPRSEARQRRLLACSAATILPLTAVFGRRATQEKSSAFKGEAAVAAGDRGTSRSVQPSTAAQGANSLPRELVDGHEPGLWGGWTVSPGRAFRDRETMGGVCLQWSVRNGTETVPPGAKSPKKRALCHRPSSLRRGRSAWRSRQDSNLRPSV